MSVLLSAQCTDLNVNKVTKDIYPKYNKPEHFVKLGRKRIEKLINSIGIFRVKAKSIYLMSKLLLEKHAGKVPRTFEELEKFYNQNKENFKLNDNLLKIRYIHIDENFSNTKELVEKFKLFDSIDKNELTKLSIKFKAFNLNDSIWIKNDLLIRVLPVLKQNNIQVLKKTNFTQLQDSLGVYLVKIEAVLKTNDIAPLSYVKPTIEQIVINKRKQEILKKIEKEITIDAIKNKNFEFFTEN